MKLSIKLTHNKTKKNENMSLIIKSNKIRDENIS